MHSIDFEAAFGRFLELTDYDEAEDALFSLVRAACQAGWLAAGGEESAAVRMFEVLRAEGLRKKS